MKQIIVILLALLLGLGLSPLVNHHAQEQAKAESVYQRVVRTNTLRCGYASWPPFLRKDPNTGQLSGFNYDIISEIGKELGLKIEWVEEVGFGNYIEGLNTNRYDVMCQTVWPDPGRFKNATVTLPVHYHKVYVVVRANDHRFDHGYGDLNDPSFKTSAIESDITETITKTDFPLATEISLPQSADASQLFMEVATGKADATFVDYGFFEDYNKNNPGKLKIAGSVLRVYGSVFSVRQGEIELKSLLDDAIIALGNNGKLAEILKRFPTNAMPPAPTFVVSQ